MCGTFLKNLLPPPDISEFLSTQLFENLVISYPTIDFCTKDLQNHVLLPPPPPPFFFFPDPTGPFHHGSLSLIKREKEVVKVGKTSGHSLVESKAVREGTNAGKGNY